ncbi:MAG: MFS transporter [Firmicutes bacterium]|nr:MFS transporter [Bacillota bacterium]
MEQLKLNKKRTFFIGLAFLAILMLWRVHLVQTPLLLRSLLTSEFGPREDNYLGVIGIIMGIDNLLAILLLPLFGMWSDRTVNRLGKRMTFILIGGALSVIFFPLMAVMFLLGSFWMFVIMIGLMKISMNLWRGPAVALMPDITPKPLRPKANAIINFVGYIGAIVGSLFVMMWSFDLDTDATYQSSATIPFFLTAIAMATVIGILLWKFRENKVNAEMAEQMEAGENLSETQEKVVADRPLSKKDKLNLWIVMTAVFLAWFAFNAIDTFGSNFEQDRFGTSDWGILGAVLALSAMASFLPCIKLTKRIGRKNSVLIGLAIVTLSLVIAMFMSSTWHLVPVFMMSGLGWALVNISAFPIVVEMASLKNIGKITGIYYIATQSAQFLTSVAAGYLFGALGSSWIDYFWLYGIVFMIAAFIMTLFFKPRRVDLASIESTPEPTAEVGPTPTPTRSVANAEPRASKQSPAPQPTDEKLERAKKSIMRDIAELEKIAEEDSDEQTKLS